MHQPSREPDEEAAHQAEPDAATVQPARTSAEVVQRSRAQFAAVARDLEAVQCSGVGAALEDPAAVQSLAHEGTSGAGGSLPHLDAIQRSFGAHDVSGVQAHVGGRAEEASLAMGAEAFATGNAVAFAGSPGLHVAAHEAAHVVQQRAGVQLKGGVGEEGDAYERHADAVADQVVRGESAQALLDSFAPSRGDSTAAPAGAQRKLAARLEGAVQRKVSGTLALLKASGAKEGGEDLSLKAKAKGAIGRTSTYAKILQQLQEYETDEANLDGGSTTESYRSKIKIGLFVPTLADIRILIMKWLDDSDHEKEDEETKKRRDALQVALGTLTKEWQKLQAEATGHTDSSEVGPSKVLGKGAMKEVTLIDYGDRKVAFSSSEEQHADVSRDVGIPEKNAKLSNRTMAMYRLDQLIGTNVIPRTEFAVHNGYVGTVMDIAEGKSTLTHTEDEVTDQGFINNIKAILADAETYQSDPQLYAEAKKYINDKGYRAENEGTPNEKIFQGETRARDVDYETKQARQGMSNLQLLDAVSGQMDRHIGNIFCQVDANGKVIGIKGIDNDLAFGKLQDDPNQFLGDPLHKGHGVGIPPLIDKKVARRMLEIKDKDIKEALKDLLDDSEIEATISRFNEVKEYIKKHKDSLVDDWDDKVIANKNRAQDEKRSYWKRDKEFTKAHKKAV
jgi:hypothetical protein